MMHAPFARGVSHLMYVGDVDASSRVSPVVYAAAATALLGGLVGIKKRHRKVAGVIAVVGFLVR